MIIGRKEEYLPLTNFLGWIQPVLISFPHLNISVYNCGTKRHSKTIITNQKCQLYPFLEWVGICEIKYSLSEFSVNADYESNLRNKKSAFIETTKTRKAVHLTMVATYGVRQNSRSGIVQKEIKLEDLFA